MDEKELNENEEVENSGLEITIQSESVNEQDGESLVEMAQNAINQARDNSESSVISKEPVTRQASNKTNYVRSDNKSAKAAVSAFQENRKKRRNK